MEGGIMAENSSQNMSGSSKLETFSKLAQTVSVIAGIVVSVWTISAAQIKDAEARIHEIEKDRFQIEKYYAERRDIDRRNRIEATKPFLSIRQKLYMETVKLIGILANPSDHKPDEINAAKKRFRQLYVAELSMVESHDVEKEMFNLAGSVDPSLVKLTPAQISSLKLSHAIRDSLVNSWQVPNEYVEK
jgi:hypothetical protein